MWQTTQKVVVNNLKSNYEKYHVDVILTEKMNWNTLMRLVSNKQNSITLPVKVFNSVASKYLQDFREQKNI